MHQRQRKQLGFTICSCCKRSHKAQYMLIEFDGISVVGYFAALTGIEVECKGSELILQLRRPLCIEGVPS